MTLTARELAIGYGKTAVGRDLTLDLAPGELVMLLGPNGCGKSTLFKTLLGLIPGLGGTVTLDGQALEELSRRQLARGLAYVPQAAGGFFPFTVVDTVLMGRTAHLGPFGAPGARDRAAAARSLDRLGLQDLAEHPFTRLSGGQRQMVLIARALAQETPYIVMDEPTASLDFGNQVRVLAQVRALKASGTGLILASHDPDQALRLADRVLVMAGGRIAASGPPTNVLTGDLLKQVYGVDAAVAEVVAEGRTLGRTCFPLPGG
ncbi:ABC transporter ATP-binding protein [Rhodovibrio salinarum]|uniref:ABC transporter ATP-binding protein n=1 Tax=Rhodovibrio salinarum TaxID=1087 RepID=A0A934QJP8_9PROT|nr:ABC transporter ATP-binding protein [Rhodovibrio salinarum]MBK1698136.1 ABC transporter ATP-binding protein [Rhodovibrio salinarum]